MKLIGFTPTTARVELIAPEITLLNNVLVEVSGRYQDDDDEFSMRFGATRDEIRLLLDDVADLIRRGRTR